jgi:hypothetical protein
LLDDFQLEAALSLQSNPYQLRPKERGVLLEFWETLGDFSRHVYETRVIRPGENYASPAQIISQPEWPRVCEKALAVLRLFKEEGFPQMPRLPIFDSGTVEVLRGYWEV